MNATTAQILSILDQCCDAFTFPMLDNGYVYLAASRLTVFRSASDWAMTIEVFGYSPRAGLPDTHIYTFAGDIRNRQRPAGYASQEAYEAYLANNLHNESRFIYPIAAGSWIDGDFVVQDGSEIWVRDESVPVPTAQEFERHGIDFQETGSVRVFELCRYLAAVRRDALLATNDELRVNVGQDLTPILRLDEWNHPDVADDACRPSGSETFQQIAEVMVTGNARNYRPTLPPNTHWRNWPAGGTM